MRIRIIDLDLLFSHLPRALVLMLGATLSGILGYLDYQTGSDLSLSVFYLLPILLVTWYAGFGYGALLSAISVAVWIIPGLFIDLMPVTPLHLSWNILVRISNFLFTAYIVAKLKSRLERERKLSSTDYLTQAANYRSFYKIVEQEIANVHRSGTIFTVAYLDIDNFKLVNDQFGHHAGNRNLIEMVDILRKNIRTTDVIGRLGGDEFAILFPKLDEKAASLVLGRICQCVQSELEHNNPISCSIGAITYLQPPASTEHLLKEVDRVMYIAKAKGKNQYCLETFHGN